MGRLINTNDLVTVTDIRADGTEFTYVSYGNIEEAPTVEAILKADYEARLKADMVAMLEDLKKEMNPIKECEYQIYGKEEWNFVGKCQDLIQQKINALKGDENE